MNVGLIKVNINNQCFIRFMSVKKTGGNMTKNDDAVCRFLPKLFSLL